MEEVYNKESMENNGIQTVDTVIVSELSMVSDEANSQQTTSCKVEQTEFGWNWGAFSFPLIWGLANGCYWQSVLALIPFFNLVWRFVMGGMGNTWSWKEGYWESSEKFNKTQKRWNVAGLIFLGIILIIVIIALSVD